LAEDDPPTSAGDHADLPLENRELEIAARDVAYRLTHDFHDTGEDLRDAAAFVPLAVVKALNGLATRAAAHPRKLALGIVLLAASILLLRRRSKSVSNGDGPAS